MTTSMSKERDITDLPPKGEVEYIQSFLPTGEYIRGISVMEVHTSQDLQSPRLGVTAYERGCETCDNVLENCHGHFGHLEMPIPIYRIFFVKTLISILNCICFYCQNLRIPKSDPSYTWISAMEPKYRLPNLLKYSKSYKRCGSERDQSLPSAVDQTCCGRLFVNFTNEDRDCTFIEAIVSLELSDHEAYKSESNTWEPVKITPQDLFDCLVHLPTEVKRMLGCGEWNQPSALMWDVLPIPSHNTRPCHTFGGIGGGKKRAYNNWTKLLKNIVVAQIALLEARAKSDEEINIAVYSMNDIVSKDFRNCFRYGYLSKTQRKTVKKRLQDEARRATYSAVEGAWRNLNKQVAAFHSFKHKKYILRGSSYGKPLVNLEERYKHQKAGRFRGNVIARRVNSAMRGVLEGDIYLRPDQVGVPIQEAMSLPIKVYVNQLNFHLVHIWITNGPYKYPGANYITLKNGREINLAYYENRRDIDIGDILFVRRHVLDGDVCMGNRQPTLHKPSMMTFYAVVIPGYVIRLHYSVFTPLAADCDGDEVNLHFPQTQQARADIVCLSGVGDCIMKDGVVMIKFILNAVIGAYLLTGPGTHQTQRGREPGPDILLDIDEVHTLTDFMVDVWEYPEPSRTIPEKLWTGRQIVSMLFPPDFCMEYHVNNGDNVLIENGQLLSGRLDNAVLNGAGGILSHMYRDYTDKEVIIKFLHQGYLMFQKFIDMYGHSAGYFDCSIDFHHEEGEAPKQIQACLNVINEAHEGVRRIKAYVDEFPEHNPETGDQAVEINFRKHIEKVNSLMCDAVNDYHNTLPSAQANGLIHAIQSGAKGNRNVLNQMCGIVSQIYVMYRRYETRSSHFNSHQKKLESFGFIDQNYSTGIGLNGVLSEAHATCESIVNKNKGTAKGGYTVRKLTTCMMGVVVDRLGRVVDTNGRIIWDVYGNDGYDSNTLTNCKLRLLIMKEWEIPKRYGILYNIKNFVVHSSVRAQQEWNKAMRHDTTSQVDSEWFLSVTSEIVDTTGEFDSVMTTEASDVWNSIKHRESTIQTMDQEIIDLLNLRSTVRELLTKSHEYTSTDKVKSPICFQHLFHRCQVKFQTSSDHNTIDITPLDYRLYMVEFWNRLVEEQLVVPLNLTFKSLFFDWLSTKSLILKWKFGSRPLHWISQQIIRYLVNAKIQPGESVGVDSVQKLGEPFVQMALKTPHLSGKFLNMTAGTVRIASIVDGNFANSTMTIVLKNHIQSELAANMFGLSLVRTYLIDICASYPTYTIYESAKGVFRCLVRIMIDKRKCIQRTISVRNVVAKLCKNTRLDISCFKCSFSTDEKWYIYIDIPRSSTLWKDVYAAVHTAKRTEQLVADNLVYNLYRSVLVSGLKSIETFVSEAIDINTVDGKSKRWCITTLGSDLANVLKYKDVDSQRTISNDSIEMSEVFGIHAARKSLQHEFLAVMTGMADERHVQLIARMMSSNLKVQGMKIQQVGCQIPPLQRAAYEQGPKQMQEYCALAERDYADTICGAALTNKVMNIGSGYELEVFSSGAPQPVAASDAMSKISTKVRDRVFSPKVDGVLLILGFCKNRRGDKICHFSNRNFQNFSIPVLGVQPEALFESTYLYGDLTAVPGTTEMCYIVYDCWMSCGNNTTVLRYDQRIEIAREIVYRLGTNNLQDCLENARQFTPVEFHANEPYALPMIRPAVSQNMFKAANFPFFITVKPLFDIEGLMLYHKKISSVSFATDGYIIPSLPDPALPFKKKKDAIFKIKLNNLNGYSENTIDMIIDSVKHPTLNIQNTHLVDISRFLGDSYIPAIEMYRADCGSLYMLSKDKKGHLLVFSRATNPLAFDVKPGQIYECRWNYTQTRWELYRPRDKQGNTLETVGLTLVNIVENIQLEELCKF